MGPKSAGRNQLRQAKHDRSPATDKTPLSWGQVGGVQDQSIKKKLRQRSQAFVQRCDGDVRVMAEDARSSNYFFKAMRCREARQLQAADAQAGMQQGAG